MNVPKTAVVNELVENLPVITIDAKENLFLQNEPVMIHDLAPRIKAMPGGEGRVSIFGRTPMPTGNGFRVMEELNTSGIKNVVVVTEPFERKK